MSPPPEEQKHPGLHRIGDMISKYRVRKGLSQSKLAEHINRSRNVVTLIEQGRRLPHSDDLDAIADQLALSDDPLWRVVTHPSYAQAIDFQEHLSELLGKTVTFEDLDPVSQIMAIESIADFIAAGGKRMSLLQAHDHFNSILTFYGEKPVSLAFYEHFLGATNFDSEAQFGLKVRAFQTTAIRIYGSFRKAFKTLSTTDDIAAELQSLAPVDPKIFKARRPFRSIKSIERERLDDLGYISAERVKRQNRERQEIRTRLTDLAAWIESNPHLGLQHYSEHAPKGLKRIKSLLRKLESHLEIEETLFSHVDPDDLRREAEHLAPQTDHLARIAETQERGLQNLATYLTEPYMDVYIATSMRERADFISVNTFVETIFSAPKIAPLNLRYFNPTLSWVADRVAKGLVEALMLKRSRLTVYMAQKGDTFGKDSEASVALGQGKPVIVYVPRLYDDAVDLSSEGLMQQSELDLRHQLQDLDYESEDELDHQGLMEAVLLTRLKQLDLKTLARILDAHWADFDLYGELKDPHIPQELRSECKDYLDKLTLRTARASRPLPSQAVANILIEKLVNVAVFFERRARTFKEIHPLALQVILSSGVLNGIIVVRSAASCTRMIYELLTNTIQTDLMVDDHNYRLVEHHTQSTLRVISRHNLLINAFWTQYFQ